MVSPFLFLKVFVWGVRKNHCWDRGCKESDINESIHECMTIRTIIIFGKYFNMTAILIYFWGYRSYLLTSEDMFWSCEANGSFLFLFCCFFCAASWNVKARSLLFTLLRCDSFFSFYMLHLNTSASPCVSLSLVGRSVYTRSAFVAHNTLKKLKDPVVNTIGSIFGSATLI